MTGTDIAHPASPGGGITRWTSSQLDIIRDTIAPGLTDGELALFGEVCRRTGLDPFRKQIYAIVRGRGDRRKMVIQTAIDGLRVTAERSKVYGGQDAPEWCGDDLVWRDVWVGPKPPLAARVKVYRKDWTRPVVGVVMFAEFADTYDGQLQGQWRSMPAHMIAKCAEAAAIRKAFPDDVGDLYVAEEFSRQDAEVPAEVVAERAADAEQRRLEVPITKEQGKAIGERTKAAGITTAELKRILNDVAGVEMRAHVREGDFEKVLAAIDQAGAKAKAAEPAAEPDDAADAMQGPPAPDEHEEEVTPEMVDDAAQASLYGPGAPS